MICKAMHWPRVGASSCPGDMQLCCRSLGAAPSGSGMELNDFGPETAHYYYFLLQVKVRSGECAALPLQMGAAWPRRRRCSSCMN